MLPEDSIAFSVLGMVIGAVLGLFIERLYLRWRRAAARKNPIRINVKKSVVPPLWFATNLELSDYGGDGARYEREVCTSSPFCGFAKLTMEIENTSEDIVDITDILVTKEELSCKCRNRVRFVNQGVNAVLRLYGCMDDQSVRLCEDLVKRLGPLGGFFERGDRVRVQPHESEQVFLGLVAIEKPWKFNCDVRYKIAGKQKVLNDVLGEDMAIVPYLPEQFVHDYCGLLQACDPNYHEFDDAELFSPENRRSDPAKTRAENTSPLERLQFLASI